MGAEAKVTPAMVDAALDSWWDETLAGASEYVKGEIMARSRPRMRRALEAAEEIRRA